MARVTVEDCLEHVENRFKLVLLASKRARQLTLGTEPLVEWENDKPTVVALREIAQDLVNEEMLQASLAVPVEEELEFDEDDLAAALHAEISRELNQTAPEPATTETPKPQEQPSPVTTNPIFGGGFSPEMSESSAVTDEQEQASPSIDPAPAPPSSDPSSEGEQGF